MDWQRRGTDRKRRRRFLLEQLEDRRLLAGQITQVGYFDTWDGGIIRSTDVAGIGYHPPSGHLYLADSEINEIPSIFNGDNVFETSLSGDQVFSEIASNNTEPTGITYNEFDGYFYVTNDTGPRLVTRYNDNLNSPLYEFAPKDDVPSATDPEGITSNPLNGDLYVVDGNGGGRQVLTYRLDMLNPDAATRDVIFQSSFSVASQMSDAEGIAYHAPSDHLFVVDGSQDIIFEYTLGGNFVDQYDINGFSPGPRSPQGLTFAPSSADPNSLSLYIADGMSDNFADGRVFEAIIGGGGEPPANTAPTTSGIAPVTVDENAPNTVINLYAAFDDIEDPDPALTYSIQNNTNTSLFASTNISGGQLTLDYAPATTGSAVITVRATDTGNLSVDTNFTVTVNPGNPGGSNTIEVQVAAGSDDAEERPSGSVTLTSSDLELIQDGSNQQVVGMRFTGLNLPPGASIQNAYIQFQADETGSTSTSLTIAGQAVDNAPTFTSASGNVTSRTTTSATVGWSPAAWNTKGEAGPDQRTPNIASVIQQIVNRPGWSSGNALAIIVSGTGKRTAESYNGVASAAPLLHVEYATGDPPENYAPTTSGIADVNVDEDAPDTLINLFDAFDDVEDPDPALTYSVVNITNPSLFTATPINGSQGTLTLDYAPATPGSADITVRATDTGSLSVETIFKVTVNPGNPGGSNTIEVRVATGSDDAEERPSGSVTLTSSDLELIQDKSNEQIVGMRFTGLTIPQGATIQNAYIQFQADEAGSEATSLTISGQAVDNAPTFTSASGNVTSRTTTSATVGWSPAAWNKGDAGPAQQTPTIAAVIQEIVNRPGWSSGNPLAIIVSGTGKRTAEAYDGVSSAAPLLHVEFVTGSPLVVQASVGPQAGAEPLNETQLAPIVDEAISRLTLSIGPSVASVLAGLNVEVVDLPGYMLGRAFGSTIQIDADAAGFGWFLDPTPYDDREFIYDASTQELIAPDGSEASQRVDLLTTVMHELGHVLGLDHSDSYGVMGPQLDVGKRWLPR